MNDSNLLRLAQPEDAEIAAVLLRSAYTHTLVTYPTPEEAEYGWVERLMRYFRLEGNRFSYQNCYVAEHGTEVVGLVLSFGGRDEARLNAAVGSWLEREARDDEWYVDALAVFRNWGRQGIGSRLMRVAEAQARERGYPRIALHVAEENHEARNLYTRLGYVLIQRTMLYQRPHVRMVKRLDGEESSGAGADSPARHRRRSRGVGEGSQALSNAKRLMRLPLP